MSWVRSQGRVTPTTIAMPAIFGTKVSVCSLILVYGLQQRNSQPDEHRRAEDRRGNERSGPQHLSIDLDDQFHTHINPLTSAPTTRFQPSTSTKIISLRGSEIMMGGTTIMPIDNNVDATTMSMTRNGRNSMKPIMKAVRSSLSMYAGVSMARAELRGVLWQGFF